MANIKTLKVQTITMAAAKGLGRLGFGLDVAATGDDIYQTCQQYGEGSRLCHRTAIGDTSSFTAGELTGAVVGNIAMKWLGCNAAFDIETLGLGVIGCTVAVGATSIAASNIASDLAKSGSTALYQTVIVCSQKHSIPN